MESMQKDSSVKAVALCGRHGLKHWQARSHFGSSYGMLVKALHTDGSSASLQLKFQLAYHGR